MKLKACGVASGGLLLRRGLLDHAHDVGLLHDQEILAIKAHLGARPLAKQHAVAGPQVEGGHLAVLVASTGPDGDHLALLRLLLGGVRDDDAAFGLLFRLNTADHNTIMQRTKLHRSLLLLQREQRTFTYFGTRNAKVPTSP